MRFVRRLDDGPGAVDTDALEACLSDYPVSIAVLFGSQAIGTASDRSDLDLAVSFQENVPRSRRHSLLDRMTAEITRTTGFEAVDLVDLASVGPALGYEILSDGLLLVGDEDDAVALESRFLQLKFDFRPVTEEWQAALADRIAGGEYGGR